MAHSLSFKLLKTNTARMALRLAKLKIVDSMPSTLWIRLNFHVLMLKKQVQMKDSKKKSNMIKSRGVCDVYLR